jgi:hypothetical protein
MRKRPGETSRSILRTMRSRASAGRPGSTTSAGWPASAARATPPHSHHGPATRYMRPRNPVTVTRRYPHPAVTRPHRLIYAAQMSTIHQPRRPKALIRLPRTGGRSPNVTCLGARTSIGRCEYSLLPSPAGSGSCERRSARSEWDARSRLGNSGLLIPVDHGTASGRQQPAVASVPVGPLHQHPPAISAAHLPQDRHQVPLAIGAQHLLELPAIGCGLVAASSSTGRA